MDRTWVCGTQDVSSILAEGTRKNPPLHVGDFLSVLEEIKQQGVLLLSMR